MTKSLAEMRGSVKNSIFHTRDLCLCVACHKLVMRREQRRNEGNMDLIQMSLSGAVMIFTILIVRALAINRLPKKVFVFLWGAVLVRLLVPFSIPSMWSAYSVIKRTAPMQDALSKIPTDTVVYQVVDNQLNRNLATVETLQNAGVGLSIGSIVWMVGAILCMVFFLISYLRCYFEFQTSIPVHNDFVVDWLGEHRLRRSIEIRQSDRIAAPLTYGIIKPVILMPKKADWNNKQQLQYILQHEYIHICRFDMLVKLIATFALCLHWFNPMVWVMYILFNRDIELYCDESVVRWFGENAKSNYARTLIIMEEKKSGLLSLYNSFSRNAIEERITAIMKTKKITRGIVIASILVVICVVVPFITSAEVSGNNAEQRSFEKDIDVSGSKVTSEALSNKDKNVNVEENNSSAELLVYVDEFDGTTLAFDVIEWVTVPGERATELNITEDDAPSGFSIYNETVTVEQVSLASNCVCKILDWKGNYVQKKVTVKELGNVLEEREGIKIPYHVFIENNEIIEIMEQYVP